MGVRLNWVIPSWVGFYCGCPVSFSVDSEHAQVKSTSVLDCNLLARLGEFDDLLVKSSVFTRGQLCVTVRL